MKKYLLLFVVGSIIPITSQAQFVAKLIVEHEFTGACDIESIYAIFGSSANSYPAACPITRDEIVTRLNSEVSYVNENQAYSDEGVVAVIINCEGKLVSCYMDRKTKNETLDNQIMAVFNTLETWKPGVMNGQKVDSTQLFNFSIRKGKFSFT